MGYKKTGSNVVSIDSAADHGKVARLENVHETIRLACEDGNITPTPITEDLAEALDEHVAPFEYAGGKFGAFYRGLMRSRDSGPMERANFRAALEMLGGDNGDTVVVGTAGHFAVGLVEQIYVRADAPVSVLEELTNIRKCLEDYPVIDDNLFAEEEDEERNHNFDSWAEKELRDSLRDAVLHAAREGRGSLADLATGDEEQLEELLDDVFDPLSKSLEELLAGIFDEACSRGSVSDPDMPRSAKDFLSYLEDYHGPAEDLRARIVAMLGSGQSGRRLKSV